MPGTRSIFTRNCGTVKWCSTSFERSSTSPAGRAAGAARRPGSGRRRAAFVVGVHAERIVDAHNEASVAPSTPSAPGSRIAPRPLLADGLDDVGVVGHRHELGPHGEPRREHRATPTEVSPISHHSSFLFSGSYSARRSTPLRWR